MARFARSMLRAIAGTFRDAFRPLSVEEIEARIRFMQKLNAGERPR